MILLVGASVRALMESAAESGYETVGLDFYGDADTCWQGSTLSLPGDYGLKPTVKHLLEVARTISCHGLVYASGPENTPRELEFWERCGILLGNGVSSLTKARNPWELCRSLGQVGVRMPRFSTVENWKQIEDGEKWLLKPLNRGGGHGILELPERREDAEKLVSGLLHPAQFIIEEFQAGIPGSVTFLANGQQAVVLGTSRQLSGRQEDKRPFLYQGNIVPLDMKGLMDQEVFNKELTKAAEVLTKDFGLKGINTLDFSVNREGVWILELNPRWSASVELIERSLGQRLFAAHLAGCGEEELTSIKSILQRSPRNAQLKNRQKIKNRQTLPFWGKRIVYAGISGEMAYGNEKSLLFLYKQGVRDIPRAGTKIERGQPLCTVLAQGFSDQDCAQRLLAKVEWAEQLFRKAEILTAI